MRILFVEDNQAFVETLVPLLQERDFDVDVTANITEAIQLFDSRHYDLVISDVHLSEDEAGASASGLALLRHIRKKRDSNVLIAVTTGLELIEESDIKKRGADLFFYKPLRMGFAEFADLMKETVASREI